MTEIEPKFSDSCIWAVSIWVWDLQNNTEKSSFMVFLAKERHKMAGQRELSGTTAYPDRWAVQGPQKPSALVVVVH